MAFITWCAKFGCLFRGLNCLYSVIFLIVNIKFNIDIHLERHKLVDFDVANKLIY